MTKRLIAFAIVLAMVASFVPVYAIAAEETVKASPKAGTHTGAAHKCEECGSTDWKTWSDGSTPPTEGHYVLTGDVTLTKEILLTGDLHICLNGYVITARKDLRHIGTKADADTTLVITDCTAYTDENEVYHAGALTGGVNLSTGGGGSIFVRRGGSCKLYDGRITGNVHKCDSAGGGAVMLQAENDSYAGGKFYMFGGEITGNKAFKANGKSTAYGGAIYANTGSYAEITGGAIAGNEGSRGGAIYAIGATVKLKDMSLRDNVGGSGTVGLYSKSTLTTENVTFTGNNTTNGSAVCAEGSSALTLKDTTITGNTATSTTGSRSAAIYVVSATVKLSGKTVIEGNTTQGAAIPDVALDNASYDTLQIHELTEGSHVVFTTPKTVPTEAEEVITLNTKQTDPWQLGWVQYMNADGTLQEIGLKDGKFFFTTKPVTPTHQHKGCNDASCADHAAITYQAWTDEKALPTEGSWYLDTDVTVEETIGLIKSVDICLNGHTITQKSGTNARMYNTKADAGVTLTISDCTAKTENGTYTAGKITGFVNTAEGSVMYLRLGTTLELFDGIIENNTGGSGGTILTNGEFKMYGGQFVGNRAGTVEDGKNGGALYLNRDAVATITGGAFLNNAADCGGAICSMGHITVRDTVFTGNSAREGGALYLRSSSTAPNTSNAVLQNVTITGNTTEETGAVYLLSSLGSLTLKGNVQITGNTGKNLYLPAGEVFAAENMTEDARVGVYAPDPGRAITADCADYTKNFTSDDTDYVVKHQDGKLWLAEAFRHEHCVCGDAACTAHRQVKYQPWSDATSLPASGSYCLLTDVTVAETINLTENVDLCLHGHTITQKSGTKAQMYNTKADAGVTLTISDCTAKTENGSYTAGKITGFVSDSEGSVMYLRAGTTLELFDGIFENNNGGSGGVILTNGELNMYGGQFVGNRAGTAEDGKNGGALYLNKDAVATITGGAFLNNTADCGGAIYSMGHITIRDTVFTGNSAREGGALYLRSSSTAPNTRNAVLQNVTITGNTTEETGAVYLLSSLGSLTLKGNVQIYGNTGKNLYLPKGYLFSAEDIAAEAKVGVTAQQMGKPVSNPCNDYTQNFISDNTKLQIVYQDGALYLDAAGNHKHCFCAGTSTHCDHEVLTFVEWDDPTSLPTSGNYYLSVDVELPSYLSPDSETLNLCLNGHTITLKSRMFYPKGKTTLRILDCTDAPGKITGATRSAILVDKNSTTTIELWNGSFTGNEGESVGGAILLQGNSTMKMYGGKITGNALISRLVKDADGNVVLNADGSQKYTSVRGGGGVGLYGENTSFYLYGGEISNNKALSVTYLDKKGAKAVAGGDGGGLYVDKGSAYLYGGTITGNYAQQHAGGIFTTYADLVIDGSTITGNSTDGGAGGIYASTGSTVLLKSGQISRNKAKGSGGGMVAQGNGTVFTYEGGTVSGNQSAGSAAGILVQGKAVMVMTGGTVTGNISKGNGGGIYISTKSKLTMTGGNVTGNTAKSQGGGVYLNKATSTISGAYIGNNTAQENTAGGLRMAGGSLTISGVQLVGNRSKGSGCGMVVGGSSNTENGVKVDYFATVNLYGCTFQRNVTEGSAGGLLIQSKGTKATLSNCRFYENQAKSNGGGLYLSTNVQATVTGCQFEGNQANRGGSVYVNNCKATLKDLTMTQNQGGAYVTGQNCQATLEGIEAYKNTDKTAAGIMIAAGAHATITDARIYNNVATATGGGVSVSGAGTQVLLKDLEIYENQAKTAGGFYAGAGAAIVAENLEIYENSAATLGGGVYNGADLTMRNSMIRNNAAGESGGGVQTWKSSSRVTADNAATKLENCQIFGNTSGGQGGGMFIHRGGPAQLTGVTITDNVSALEGSGIYCDGRMDLKDTVIRQNTAGDQGYAVYLTPADYDGHSYFSGYKNIAGNTIIEDNNGGDLYMAEGIALAISGATLGDDARIHVTLSDGVLTQRVVGVYHYEGEDLNYVLTAGDRSITEPMVSEEAREEKTENQTNTYLYVLVGAAAVIALGAVLLVAKKKKAANAKQN